MSDDRNNVFALNADSPTELKDTIATLSKLGLLPEVRDICTDFDGD